MNAEKRDVMWGLAHERTRPWEDTVRARGEGESKIRGQALKILTLKNKRKEKINSQDTEKKHTDQVLYWDKGLWWHLQGWWMSVGFLLQAYHTLQLHPKNVSPEPLTLTLTAETRHRRDATALVQQTHTHNLILSHTSELRHKQRHHVPQRRHRQSLIGWK